MTQSEIWARACPDPEQAFRSFGIMPDLTGVDLCCGEGYFTVPLAKFVGGNLYVFDVDPETLRRTRAAVEGLGVTARGWISDDTEQLADVLPELVDFVFMANGTHGVADTKDLAKTVRSVLTADGRFVMIEWYPLAAKVGTNHDLLRGPVPAMRASPDELRATVEPAGFRLGQVVDLPPDHYGAVFHTIAPEVVG